MIYMYAFYPNNPYHFPHSVLCWMLNTGIFYSMINGDQAEVASKLLYKFCLGSKELDNSKNNSNNKINRNHQKNKKNELKISIIFNISQSTMAVKCTFPFSTIKGQRFLLKNDY